MRRSLLIGLFITILLAVLVGGHLYLAQRLILDPELAPPLRTALLALMVLLGATLVIQPITERVGFRLLARAVAWPASLWMGFAFVLLTLVALSDLVWALLGATTDSAAAAITAARARALGVGVIAAFAGSAGVRRALRAPTVKRIELRLVRWPAALDGFRIVQISDLHIGPILDRRFAAALVARCNALDPDLVAVTGDLVDGSVGRLADEVAPLAHLHARHGVFFVTGNHDHYSDANAWADHAATLGMRVLRNEHVRIAAGGAAFLLAGVEDHHAHLVSSTHREDLPQALAGRVPGEAVILLAHDPATFPAAAGLDVDLQLSGHTHGGQIWPFGYLVRLSTPFVAGHYRRGASQLYVSSGTGFWGPAMRLLTTAEITDVVLRHEPPLRSRAAVDTGTQHGQ